MITAEIWFALESPVDDTVGTLTLVVTGEGTKHVLSQALRFFVEFEPSINSMQITCYPMIYPQGSDFIPLELAEMWEWVKE